MSITSKIKILIESFVYKFVPMDVYLNVQQKVLRRVEPIIPQYIYQPFQNELSAALTRSRTKSLPQRYENAKHLLLNIGAGPYGKSGWVNIDIYEASGINCVYDCRKSLPFPDNSVKGIFTEHFFEHLDYVEDVPFFLQECYRVLEPQGVIRIIVPDLEKYLHAYCQEGWEELSQIRPLDAQQTDFHYKFKYNTKMELINFVFRQGFEHKYAYDYVTLEFLLNKYGFSNVVKQEFGKSRLEELCIDQQVRASESLYVEAIKSE